MEKSCSFINALHSECSKKPIIVRVNPGENCAIKGTVDLPSDYGDPRVTFHYCKTSSCTNYEKHVRKEVIEFEGNSPLLSFTQSLNRSFSNFQVKARGASCIDRCILQFNISTVPSCDYENNYDQNAIKNSENNFYALIIPAVIILFLFFAITISFYVFQKRFNWRKYFWLFKQQNSFPYEVKASDTCEQQQEIFIAYADEHPLHREAVLKFATFLEADYNCKVFLDLYDKEKIYIDPAGWLDRSMCSEKVIIVWSPETEERWKQCNKHVGKCDMLTPVLKKIKNDIILNNDVSKFLLVHFDYGQKIQKPSILKNVQTFVLIKQIHQFLEVLSGDKIKNRKGAEKYCKFNHYISAFEETLKKSSTHISEYESIHVDDCAKVSMKG